MPDVLFVYQIEENVQEDRRLEVDTDWCEKIYYMGYKMFLQILKASSFHKTLRKLEMP